MTHFRGDPKAAAPNSQGRPHEPGPETRAALADEARPLRMFYVDPKTGLPMRSVFARANKLDKPIFKAIYSYPADIKIEPPAP